MVLVLLFQGVHPSFIEVVAVLPSNLESYILYASKAMPKRLGIAIYTAIPVAS